MPRVSTYRMAGHLATAFTIFSALVRAAVHPRHVGKLAFCR